MAVLPGRRIRDNGVFGTITDNPLTMGATTFNSADLNDLSVVAGDHAIVTLDPFREFGDPEIVMVTAHTAAATVATIQRGMFGTVARQHPVNTLWVHAATNDDFIRIVTSSTRPTDSYRGQGIYETDTDRFVARNSADVWQQEGLFFDPPACRVFHSVSQNAGNNVFTQLQFNSERYDTNSMHDNSVQNTRITCNTPGIYLITGHVGFVGQADYTDLIVKILLNGTTDIAYTRELNLGTPGGVRIYSLATAWKLALNDFIELSVFQSNTDAGVAIVENTPARSPEFSATWIGRGN